MTYSALPLLLLAACGSATVVVINRHDGQKVAAFRDASASFGRSLPDDGLSGIMVQARPADGCSAMAPAPEMPQGQRAFALIARYGGCNFEDKVRAAERANFSAAVVHNVKSDKLVPMGGEDEGTIPSVFIGASDAQLISRHFIQPQHPQYLFVLTDDADFDLSAYLLPFVIVAGICVAVMMAVVCYKCIQDHRRKQRHRLPRSALKRLPVVKWKEGDPYECCCVCLEDYVEGDKLRVLPCDHAYHAKCIDPWLVKNKRICPQCRQRVFGGGRGRGSAAGDNSDSDTEADESAPLLRGGVRRYDSAAAPQPRAAAAVHVQDETMSESAPPAVVVVGQQQQQQQQQQSLAAALAARAEERQRRRRARREERRNRRRAEQENESLSNVAFVGDDETTTTTTTRPSSSPPQSTVMADVHVSVAEQVEEVDSPSVAREDEEKSIQSGGHETASHQQSGQIYFGKNILGFNCIS